jgi:hypothetical protein
MRFSSALAFVFAALTSAGALGCSTMTDDNPFVPPGAPGVSPSIALDETKTLTLAPGEARRITAHTAPASDMHHVRFALIGEALDASLDRAFLDTDTSGAVSVTLRAPTRAATFRIRVSIVDGHGSPVASSDVGVAVSAQGFGVVRVIPRYAGSRAIKGWTANLVAGRTCASLAASLPADPPGALSASTLDDEPLLVSGAPVGPNLAVVVRSSHYLIGCADALGLTPDATLDVKVAVFDEPLEIGATDLDLSLAFAPDPGAYGALLAGPTALLTSAFTPFGTSEAALLLDGMAAQATDTAAFMERRKALGWDALTKQHLAAQGAPLGERLGAWAKAGLSLGAREIRARLQAISNGNPAATITLMLFTGVDAVDAGITPDQPGAIVAAPDDALILAGDLAWAASRLAGGAALLAARQDLTPTVTMGDALAHVADCAGLADTLAGFGACDEHCMEALCRGALTARFDLARASAAAASPVAMLHIDATGQAVIDDDAAPVGLVGTWLGNLRIGTTTVVVKGSLTGKASRAPSKP